MEFAVYNPIKAAQVISYFAMQAPTRSINILKAVKLVYLSDRLSIEKWGFPILDEKRVSMDKGPVNSSTYSYINGEYDPDECGWSLFLTDREKHEVSVNDSITCDDLDELSDADIQCMSDVWSEFGSMNQWNLVEWTHDSKNIPEWEAPNGTSASIPLERIMKYLGVENIDKQIETINDHKEIDKLFASLTG